MNSFWTSALANFFGSAAAGFIILIIGYRFITRNLEIMRPRRERLAEQELVCDLLVHELRQFCAVVEAIETKSIPASKFPPLHTDAWETVKGSQSVRFLPIACLEPILSAYSGIYNLQRWLVKLEDAELREWTTDNPGRAGAAILGKRIAGEFVLLALNTRQASERAIAALDDQKARSHSSW